MSDAMKRKCLPWMSVSVDRLLFQPHRVSSSLECWISARLLEAICEKGLPEFSLTALTLG